jgi:hypothetical protein
MAKSTNIVIFQSKFGFLRLAIVLEGINAKAY